MATVDIRDVRKNFGTTKILHGVSVAIEDGQFVVLVGPSAVGSPRCCACSRASRTSPAARSRSAGGW